MGGVQRQGPPLLPKEDAVDWVQTHTGHAIGFLTSVEVELLLFYLLERGGKEVKKPYPAELVAKVGEQLIPVNEHTFDDWAQYMVVHGLPIIDAFVEDMCFFPLQEQSLLNRYAENSIRMEEDGLRECMRVLTSSCDVTVVSKDTHRMKYVAPPWPPGLVTWRAVLRYMFDHLRDEKVVFVDCGLLSIPLLVALKLHNITAIRCGEKN
jgi:hypothetical protein